MYQNQRHRATGVAAAALTFALLASSCGGGDDTQTDDGQDPATERSIEPETDVSGEGDDQPAPDEATGDESGQAGVAASIPWTAPDGLDASTIAVSPGGDQVVVGFGPFGTDAVNAEVVVFDVAAGTEAWRGSIDDAGSFGLGGLMFTTTGVSFYLRTFDGAQLVTFTDGNTSTVDVDFECAQFLSGTVNSTENVAYTVVPGGFCRVDLSTGDAIEVTAGDLLEGAVGANSSIQYGPDGSLVATMMNADGAPASVSVDPATLAAIGPVDDTPLLLGNEYRDLLIAGPSLASNDRVAGTPDRSTIVLLQPDTLEVLG